jgi:hypothetical protein
VGRSSWLDRVWQPLVTMAYWWPVQRLHPSKCSKSLATSSRRTRTHTTRPGSDRGAGVNGYILGDHLVGVLNLDHGRRLLFFIAEVAGAGVEDYSGYYDGEAILGRLRFA